jgi:hypothetical protein
MHADIFSLNATQSRILESLITHEIISHECKTKGTTSYQLSKTEPRIPIGTWNDNYKFLEENMLIEKHILKKEDGRGTKPYSITPLGITQLYSNTLNMSSTLLDKVLIFLKCKYLQVKEGGDVSYVALFRQFTNEIKNTYLSEGDLIEIFQHVLSGVKIHKQGDTFRVFLNFESVHGYVIRLEDMHINRNITSSKIFNFPGDGKTSSRLNTNHEGFDLRLSMFIIQAFSYMIIHVLEEERSGLHTNDKQVSLIRQQLKSIPLEIFGIAYEFQERLIGAQMAHGKIYENVETAISQRFEESKTLNIHDPHPSQEVIDRVNQFDAYDDVLDRISIEEITVNSKDELKELMFETKAWKTKKELNQFFRDFPKSIRKGFGEAFFKHPMYFEVFATDLKELKKQKKLYEKKSKNLNYDKK